MTQPKDGPLHPGLCASGGSPWPQNWEGGPLHSGIHPLGPLSARTHPEVATQKSLLQAGPTCIPSPRTHTHKEAGCWEPQVEGQEVGGPLFLRDTDRGTPPLGAPPPQHTVPPLHPVGPATRARSPGPRVPSTHSWSQPLLRPYLQSQAQDRSSKGQACAVPPLPHSISLSSELPTWGQHAPKVGHGLGPGSYCKDPLDTTLHICYPQLRYL